MLCSHHLDIRDTFESGASRFHFVLGSTNQEAGSVPPSVLKSQELPLLAFHPPEQLKDSNASKLILLWFVPRATHWSQESQFLISHFPKMGGKPQPELDS